MELNVSGMHKDLEGHIPIVLGTIPLQSLQSPTPFTDVLPAKSNGQDISNIPTQPASPASPPENGAQNVPGWNASLYPDIRMYLLHISCLKSVCLTFILFLFNSTTILPRISAS